MEKLTQKWCVVAFFKQKPDGFEFHMRDWPQHVTFVSVFKTKKTGIEILKALSDGISSSEFQITAQEKAYFGPNKDIEVTLIEKSEDVVNLKAVIDRSLEVVRAIYNLPQYEGEGYAPHSTIQKNGALNSGDKVLIKSVSLVDMYPDDDGQRRRVIGTVSLSNSQK